jgi:glycosyltransferase involved in cell wall biosynthesis
LARYEKGSDIFQEAIKLILSNEVASEKWRVARGENQVQPVTRYQQPLTVAGRSVKFVMQWPEDFDFPDGRRCAPDPDLLKDERVKFSKDLLTGEAFWDFLQQADVIVLPYRSESYRARVSRVAIEAAILGKPMVYSKGTWISEVVAMVGAGVAIAEETPQSLAEAIQMAIGDLDMLQSEAECGVARVRKFYSVSSFHYLLVELGGNKKSNISE